MKRDGLQLDIIGLLGPAGSGKDLVADWFVKNKNFVKIAFADPMKRFAQQTFGLAFEHLWGPSEKRNEMFEISEAWWFEAIGHFGHASKEIVHDVLEEGSRVEGYLKLHEWLTNLRKEYREKISARVILQTLGTEWGRAVDELMWAKYAFRCIDQVNQGHYYTQEDGISYRNYADNGPLALSASIYAGAVIPDHRFRNEVEYTHNHNGYVLRLRRLSIEKKEEDVGVPGHRSEAEHKELLDKDFNLVLEFPEGIDKVYEMMEQAFTDELWNQKNPVRMHLL